MSSSGLGAVFGHVGILQNTGGSHDTSYKGLRVITKLQPSVFLSRSLAKEVEEIQRFAYGPL